MRTRVFEPLGMTSTTFDYAAALAGNHATSHAPDVDGKPALAVMELNYSIIPVRPAGAAWSNIRDMLEVRRDGAGRGRAAGREAVHPQRHAAGAPQRRRCRSGKDATYGMGLMVDTKYGTSRSSITAAT